MTPMYFGRSTSPLYGVYHAPVGHDRNQGLVLCYPFGQEYMRAHRAFRQLATQLSQIGFHVLRFDYRGTGDSHGELEGITIHDWLLDIADAVQELRDTAGVSRIGLLGLRLGSLLAGIFCRSRTDIDFLIVFDPVISGVNYEAELLEGVATDRPSEYGPALGNVLTPDGDLYHNGFEMPESFRSGMRTFDLSDTVPVSVPRVFQIVSHETEEFQKLRDSWSEHAGFHYEFAEAPHDWNNVDSEGGILLPQPVIRAIVRWVDERRLR